MRTRVWAQRTAAAAVVAIGVLVPGQRVSAANSAAVDVLLDYSIYASGLRVADCVVDLTLDTGAYNIGLFSEPRGIVSWITRWQYEARSTGVLQSHGTLPLSHETERRRRSGGRKFRIAYDDLGPVQETHEPPKLLTLPVPAENKSGTLDPLSATVALIRGVSLAGGCPSDLPIYDGRRRFDISFVESETVHLDKSRFSAFEGEAIRCRLQFTPIAGDFDLDDRSSFWYEEALEERQIDMWLAPILGEDAPPIPVKLHGVGRYGPFYIHLTSMGHEAPVDDATADGRPLERPAAP